MSDADLHHLLVKSMMFNVRVLVVARKKREGEREKQQLTHTLSQALFATRKGESFIRQHLQVRPNAMTKLWMS